MDNTVAHSYLKSILQDQRQILWQQLQAPPSVPDSAQQTAKPAALRLCYSVNRHHNWTGQSLVGSSCLCPIPSSAFGISWFREPTDLQSHRYSQTSLNAHP